MWTCPRARTSTTFCYLQIENVGKMTNGNEKGEERWTEGGDEGDRLGCTYHTGKQFPVIITGHTPWTVQLEPAILPRTHTEQTGVDLKRTHTHIHTYVHTHTTSTHTRAC